ncbi:MAG: DedA family protein [Planctomycetes bacterium]|nr:DedA family protein [Planctomycetota bacterium]
MLDFATWHSIANSVAGTWDGAFSAACAVGTELLQNAASLPASLPASAASGEFTKVVEFLSQWGYAGIIIILLLCGLGLPVPEEVTLIGSGYLCYVAKSQGSSHPNWIMTSCVCVFGILAGDTIVYSLGRRFGNALLKLPIVRHELTPNRLERFDRLFHKYGQRAIFFSRFVMGVRLASYFVAGRQRLSYPKFILLDLAGALVSGPTSVFFGYYFGSRIESAFEWAHKSNRFVIVLLVAAVVGMVVFAKLRKKREKHANPPIA